MEMVIEGTFAEVQQRLSTLRLKSEARLRVTLDDKDAPDAPASITPADAERRNGLIVMPLEYDGKPLTTEIVKMLSEGE